MPRVIGYALRRDDAGTFYSGYGIKDGAAFIHWQNAPDKPRTLDAAIDAASFCRDIICLRHVRLSVVQIVETDVGGLCYPQYREV